ncbi:MAG: phosphate butyryltransferase [Firmicutes bacterium]|nr:phosphate butyryltransferase [Bacillota bacterium]
MAEKEGEKMIRGFADIYNELKTVSRKSVLFAGLYTGDQFKVIEEGLKKNILDTGILIGDKKGIEAYIAESDGDFSGFSIIDCKEDSNIMETAISNYKTEDIDILIKGKVDTATFMRAVLRQKEFVTPGTIVSDCMLYEIPLLKKIIVITDPSINIEPSLEHKIKILKNSILFYRTLFERRPKVAVLSYTESLNEKDQNCIDATFLSCLSHREDLGGDVEGPLALDLALRKESAKMKGMEDNTVAGDADIILVPNLLVGNALAKSLSFLTNYNSAGLLVGLEKTVVLTSRAAKTGEKVNSLAVAGLYSHKRNIT